MKRILKRVEKKRLSDQIVEQITSLLSDGKLKPGNKLPSEHVLMELFGVGRSSVREAKRALILTGLLSSTPGHGTYILASSNNLQKETLGKESIRHFFEARIILEQATAELAAKNATPADIAKLRNILVDLKAAKKDTEKFVQGDLAFHFALAEAGHNEVVYRFLMELRPLIQAWTEQGTALISDRTADLERHKHEEILEAVERKDGEKARLLMRTYLEHTSKSLTIRLLKKQIKLYTKKPYEIPTSKESILVTLA